MSRPSRGHASLLQPGASGLAAVVFGLLAAVLLITPSAHGAPPGNDNFASATPIAGASGSIAGTNVEATREAGEPEHGGSGSNSVWYRWTSPFTGRVEFQTCGAEFDTLLAVYSGSSLATLDQLDADDDSCELASRVTVSVSANSVYHVAVDGLGGAQQPFTLQWRRFVGPPNDTFASARTLSGVRGQVSGTNLGASGERGEPGSLSQTSVWYRWRAPRTVPVVFSTCGARFDTVLGIYSGRAVSALTRVVENDDACGLASRVTLQARAGRTYHIAVAAVSDAGQFRLRWEPSGCRVPRVVGLMLGQAKRAIVRAGCRVGPIRMGASVLPPRGVILAQWPNAGTRLPFRGAVHLLVSLGPP